MRHRPIDLLRTLLGSLVRSPYSSDYYVSESIVEATNDELQRIGPGSGIHNKYKENDRLTLPSGEPFGHYSVIESLSSGLYRIQCGCGSEPIIRSLAAISSALRLRAPRIYSCGCVRLPSKPRLGRPPANRAGETIGRLQVGDWEAGKGWLCLCLSCQEAGFPEHTFYVRHSAGLAPKGHSECEKKAEFEEEKRMEDLRNGIWSPR